MRGVRDSLVVLMLVAVAVVSSGCPLLVAAGVGGAGAAAYYGGRLEQTMEATVSETCEAAVSALEGEGLPLYEKKVDSATAHIESEYADGKNVWIDADRISEKSTKVTVRVGGVVPDKQRAFDIMDAIEKRLRTRRSSSGGISQDPRLFSR